MLYLYKLFPSETDKTAAAAFFRKNNDVNTAASL